ncbi:hypothetical protein WA026_003178 [Henosepilachna vigintioctopunctata]|uniref:Uncharacterized protein n=1 Tax=Henosepilachna vigintioctopunctata TaxID=420089 RepID=A0AAW1TJ30_9CUCU
MCRNAAGKTPFDAETQVAPGITPVQGKQSRLKIALKDPNRGILENITRSTLYCSQRCTTGVLALGMICSDPSMITLLYNPLLARDGEYVRPVLIFSSQKYGM